MGCEWLDMLRFSVGCTCVRLYEGGIDVTNRA
jgi:hypothetical protein